MRRSTGNFGEDDFDAVGGGTRHETEDQERILGHGKVLAQVKWQEERRSEVSK